MSLYAPMQPEEAGRKAFSFQPCPSPLCMNGINKFFFKDSNSISNSVDAGERFRQKDRQTDRGRERVRDSQRSPFLFGIRIK
mmetsp:Transcript_39984/g.78812  ORF Transcript_39984/g.78812 Transcript_39984/m.78812 type:complete len:82 (-) Transcript_39984:2686-2931(-)